ncbi:16S rRNA (uracil(1498)-N(3))-methyltransferase [Porticoccus sp. W117]|uniref:16S rRNA (uracil(1498)-N(3))-methyltransferase n=1 Tax=Porticoccus sp. W117 TaxID=3054777 RepID=UPI0025956B93|nr:16S rRNA (uracil(1498)-N(3))-methyltransferase [Porticoccus sp. W117]MDM3870842.1 16S rRNA (uracil(1498)-N(3))-methyltransferase [Porticoccus sp. W117]
MRISRIYLNQPLAVGSEVTLSPEATRHLVTVLRAQAGAQVVLFNGTGGEYSATLVEIGKKQALARIDHFSDIDRASPLAIHLGIGLSRGDRFDTVVQKATELGVAEITPLYTERTEVKLKGDRADKKLRHWQQIAISACEQCQLNRVPTIHHPVTLQEWLANTSAKQKFVLHHRSEKALRDYRDTPHSVALAIGPEGGLSDMEIQACHDRDFKNLTLGPRVLRTETAPLAAISLLQFQWGDW